MLITKRVKPIGLPAALAASSNPGIKGDGKKPPRLMPNVML